MELDNLDTKILKLLMDDAGMSYKTIASKCKTTIGTVHNRIKRMKDEGVILRMIPELDTVKLGFDICVLIEVQVKGGRIESIEKQFSKHPNVCSIYDITGDFDTVLVAKFKNTQELNAFVKRMNNNEAVLRTSTKLVLNVVKEGVNPSL